MKTNQTLLNLSICILLCLNLSCEKTNKKTNSNEVEISENEKFKKEKHILSTTRLALKSEKNTYKNNLEVLSKYSKIKNGEIQLEIPVPTKDYKYHQKYDVSSNTISAIVYVITDNKKKKALGEPITHILKDNIPLSFIGGNVKNDNLVVFVVNDHPDDFNTDGPGIVSDFKKQIANGNKNVVCKALNFLDDKDIVKPKEACGGIIVR